MVRRLRDVEALRGDRAARRHRRERDPARLDPARHAMTRAEMLLAFGAALALWVAVWALTRDVP